MSAVRASATSITLLALAALLESRCGGDGGTGGAAGTQASGTAGTGGQQPGTGGAGTGGAGTGGAGTGGGGGTGGATAIAPARGRVAAGLDWTCAIAENAALTCWGAGVTSSPPAGSFAFVGAGDDSMCAVSTAGAVTCWTRSATAITAIDRSPPSSAIAQVVIGGASTSEFGCALRTDGTPVCWRNSDAAAMPALTTPPASARLRDVAAGPKFACGVGLDGTISCWGTSGEAALTGLPAGTFGSIAAGEAYACASPASGPPRCWGLAPTFETSFGQSVEVVQLAASRSHTTVITCGLLKDGRVFCFRGDGTAYAPPPAPVPAFSEISVGASHVCGVAADRSVVCWSDSAKPATLVPAGLHVPAR